MVQKDTYYKYVDFLLLIIVSFDYLVYGREIDK